MNEYIPINLTYYDPRHSLFKAGRNDRERVTLYTCNNTEHCDAFKRGKCVMLNGLLSHSCPYGKTHTETGYTKAARKCGVLIEKKKAQYEDIKYSKDRLGFLCSIGDYIYLPLPHLRNYCNSIREEDFFIGYDYDIIRKEDFTPEFIVELIQYRPLALMGGEIVSYQKEEVPKFCTQLKRYMPQMFESVEKIYPEINDRIQDIDYRGKKAKVKTLLPGDVKLSTDILEWDGKVLKANGKQISFWHLHDEEVTIIPNDNTYVEITSNATVTDETEFMDE